MKRSDHYAWQDLTARGELRWLKYSFGPGSANTLAVRLDGGWLVVSPAAGAPAHVFDSLADDGGVIALLSPNAYHHTGQAAWRERFPNAPSYAPRAAFARLAKKSAGVDYRPLEELERELPSNIRCIVPDGLKSPDVLLCIVTPSERVWWLGELFSNSSKADQVWLLRLVSRLFGSGLGYRRNTRPGVVYVKDEDAWLTSLRRILGEAPPSIVLPAHGDCVREDTAERTRRLIQP